MTPATTTSTAPIAIGTPKPNTPAVTKKPDEQKLQQIQTAHSNFVAQPEPQLVPSVTFNPNYRLEGSDRWQGPQYEVYRSYRPERHDESYYRSHYSRVELIGGGYYYQNNNYWYPAWGYSPQHEYYAYDAPIYVGHRGTRPDRVTADVQAVLKDMGYYTGQVDGLLGPLTRRALIGYQSDAGLISTATIDEPTLDSLNLNS
ncbi:MAG: peptidoglycan-binding protein [Verrucomicrobiota bacterium]|nr:peptidoglycan-binding protein [Verrucomicrobiota bacterium]